MYLTILMHFSTESYPGARININMVSESREGVIASGVVKVHANNVFISGHDGGTGASRWTGIKNVRLPWQIGLVETHKRVLDNDLFDHTIIQAYDQLKRKRGCHSFSPWCSRV